MNKIKQITFILLLTVLVAACADLQIPSGEQALPPEDAPAEGSDQEIPETAVSEPQSLTGTVWNVTALNNQPLLPTTAITAEFSEDGQVAGSSGCNNYSAAYVVDGDTITFNMSPAAMTLMACPQPIMNQETAYMTALETAVTYAIDADELSLFDAESNPIVIYEAVSQDLADSAWEVISYNNGKEAVVSVILDTTIDLNFDNNGQLFGFAGCNHYAAPYAAADGSFSLGQSIKTDVVCSDPAGIMEQEDQYLAALATAATYTIDGDTMNMRTAEGATAVNLQKIQPEEEPVAGPLDAMLGNIEYSSEFTTSGTALLVDGEYREAAAPDSATETVVMLTDFGDVGALNEQPTIAVVLATDAGGSGTFYTLHVVQDVDGEPVDIAAIALGDRIQINSINIEENQIVVDMIAAGPDDPLCCPTQHVINTYELQDGTLVETSSEIIGTVESEDVVTPAGSESDMAASGETAVSGMITNIDNALIQDGAVAKIQIQDTSLADAPATVMGELTIENLGQFPIVYEVAYQADEIIDNHTYTMSVRIETADGTLLFINDTAIPVITNDNPTENVEVPVIEISG